MSVFRVEFSYVRTVVTHLEAETEDDIHEFLEDNPDWDILEDAAEIVDEDETVMDGDCEYHVEPSAGVSADYGIHVGQLVEIES